MKVDIVLDLIRSHYTSEDEFHNVIDKLIKTEETAERHSVANRLRSTFNHYSGKKRDGYTVRPLHELVSLNKDNSRMCEVRKSDITLKDVVATPEIIKTISNSIREYKARERLKEYGLEVSNKILLSGPPGVGKTWTAMAIAGELGLDLVFVRWDTLISSYLGSTGNNLRKIFEVAQNPVVLFLDEFDAAGKDRGGGGINEVGEMSRVVINLLQNIDLFPPESFLVAATNHGQLLDTAIWRRFNVVNMELPTDDERSRLILQYSKGLPITIELEEWIKNTQGMSGADVKTKIHKEAKEYILNSQIA